MATHSSILTWKISRMEEPAVHGVAKSRTQLSDFTFTFPFLHWRNGNGKEMATTPVFLPGESQGRGA